MSLNKTFKIQISGRVQGVGFRPFIYNLATQYKIKGTVTNTVFGVEITVQTSDQVFQKFFDNISLQAPPSSKIEAIAFTEISENVHFDDFQIVATNSGNPINAPLTPDFAICSDCKTEILDKNNRRFYYPFTTCTSCGSRYAVTQSFPFERENTSLYHFKMCPECQHEYNNPKDKRFYSQTNTCSTCGIPIWVTNANGEKLFETNSEIFPFLANQLKAGSIIALKNTSGYLLLCDATKAEVVQKLRLRKQRPVKPLAVLFPNEESLHKNVSADDFALNELQSAVSPIVILPSKTESDVAINEVSPINGTIGALLPYSGLLHLLCHETQIPLVATSGNVHGSPICSNEKDAEEKLKNIADFFLHHSLEILHPQDDSVVRLTKKKRKIIVRRARGLAPNCSLPLAYKEQIQNKKVVALGADLKSSIAIFPNAYLYASEYLGNLSNFDTALRFRKTIQDYFSIFKFQPEVVVKDKHPLYESGRMLEELQIDKNNIKVEEVQHHIAHFSAILTEHNLWQSQNKVLGVIWDGIGFGTENEIWGGEFFEYQKKEFKRIRHFENFNWILGDKMSKNPKISLLSLWNGNPDEIRHLFSANEWILFEKQKKQNTLQTSSVGRLIDAVACLLGFTNEMTFEGEAAIYLESLAQKAYDSQFIKTDYLQEEDLLETIPSSKIIEKIALETKQNKSKEEIALNFHFTLVKVIEKVANFHSFKEIAYSGGVFQNALLIDLIEDQLAVKINCYFHENLSPNDENIAFGQLNYSVNFNS